VKKGIFKYFNAVTPYFFPLSIIGLGLLAMKRTDIRFSSVSIMDVSLPQCTSTQYFTKTFAKCGSTLCFQTLVSILLCTIPLMGHDSPTLRSYTCIVSARATIFSIKRSQTMRIDIHAHYFPEKYLDLLQRFGSEATDVARNRGAGGNPNELEARLALMDSAQVQMQVLSVSPQLPYLKMRPTR